MTLAEPPSFGACPGCVAAPALQDTKRPVASNTGDATIQLSVPSIHCASCISGVERILNAQPGVTNARVNLTQKRASVQAEPDVAAAALIEALLNAGYEAHELDPTALSATSGDTAARGLLMRLGVAGFAMMNVMLLSVAVWSGASDATRDLFHWISALIAIPTIAFSAQPFFRNAWRALGARRLNMDVPISLAIILAACMSLYETASGGQHAYFDAALSLTFFLLAGRYLDQRTRQAARSAAEELSALEVARVTKLEDDGRETTIDVSALIMGDVIRVRPGGRIPADGVIAAGASEIDCALLTGETLPEFKAPGMKVNAGAVNLTGPLDIRVSAAGRDSSLRQMTELVAVAEMARTRYTSLADRAARIYAPLVHVLAALAFAGWYIGSGDLRLSLNIAIAVLIITCPCALGLAVPAVTTAASGRLFRRGLLIKNATALERLADVDTVVFDKTGTLTEGRPVLTGTDATDTQLAVALALAKASSHPLSQAIIKASPDQSSAVVGEIREVPGYGIEGIWEGKRVRLGRGEWLGSQSAPVTTTWLQIGDAEPIAFRFRDTLRSGAERIVGDLQALGCEVALLSGDTEGAVASLAKEIGVSDWHAGTLPAEKAACISKLAASGRHVLMVGDGLNDTAALAAAHVSISPASALDASRAVSDMVLLGRDLAPLAEALKTSRSATCRIRENFAIAALYNAIAVPLALAGFATPLMAALAMSGSSIMVTLNALRLR